MSRGCGAYDVRQDAGAYVAKIRASESPSGKEAVTSASRVVVRIAPAAAAKEHQAAGPTSAALN